MATQLAPTPVVKRKAAIAIHNETKRKPTEASRRGAQILAAKYSRYMR